MKNILAQIFESTPKGHCFKCNKLIKTKKYGLWGHKKYGIMFLCLKHHHELEELLKKDSNYLLIDFLRPKGLNEKFSQGCDSLNTIR